MVYVMQKVTPEMEKIIASQRAGKYDIVDGYGQYCSPIWTTDPTRINSRFAVGDRIVVKYIKIESMNFTDIPWLGPFCVVRIKEDDDNSNQSSSSIMVVPDWRIFGGTADKDFRDYSKEEEIKEMFELLNKNVSKEDIHRMIDLMAEEMAASGMVGPDDCLSAFIGTAAAVDEENKKYFVPKNLFWMRKKCRELRLPFPTRPLVQFPKTETLLTEPLGCIDVKSDGNCWFRSISLWITGTEKHYHKLRMKLMKAYRENRAIRDMVGDVDDHIACTRVDLDGTWVTEIEIITTAMLLNTNIYVYIRHADEWRLFGSSGSYEPGLNSSDMCMYVEHVNGNHFQVVTSVKPVPGQPRVMLEEPAMQGPDTLKPRKRAPRKSAPPRQPAPGKSAPPRQPAPGKSVPPRQPAPRKPVLRKRLNGRRGIRKSVNRKCKGMAKK